MNCVFNHPLHQGFLKYPSPSKDQLLAFETTSLIFVSLSIAITGKTLFSSGLKLITPPINQRWAKASLGCQPYNILTLMTQSNRFHFYSRVNCLLVSRPIALDRFLVTIHLTACLLQYSKFKLHNFFFDKEKISYRGCRFSELNKESKKTLRFDSFGNFLNLETFFEYKVSKST